MTEDMSLTSLRELTQRDSTISGAISVEEKIQAVQSVTQTIQSRILFYQGKMWQANDHIGDMTQGNRTAAEIVEDTNNYAEELQRLWTVTAAVLMRTEMMRTAVFNSLAQNAPDFNSSLNYHGSQFPRLNRFLGVLEEQKLLCQELEQERQVCLNKRAECVSFLARVGERIQDNTDSRMQEEQLKRMKKMYAHIICARTMINHLIVRSHIDLVAHPEVLEIKIRSRTLPIINF